MTWREEERRIDGARRSRERRTTDQSNQHVLDWASYNGPDVTDVAEAEASDRKDATIARVDRVNTDHDQLIAHVA